MIEISATRPTMGSRFPRIATMLAVFAVLAGCGGGGGGPPPADPVTEYRALPPGVPMDAYHWADTFSPGSPVMAFGDVLHVGSDVAPPADALAPGGTRGGAALSRGHVRDGVGGEDVAEWVRLAAMHNLSDRSVTGLATYGGSRPAIVTLVRGPETRNRFTRFARLTQDAVAILNTGLPFEDRLRFNRYLHPGNAFPRMIGEIRVRFIPKTDPLYPEGADPGELGRTRVSYYAKDGTAAVHEVSGDGASYSDVLVDPEAVGPLSDPEATHVLVHELLHAVGFVSHTDPARFASTLSDVGFYPGTQPRSLIHPIDREGLLAAYGRFEPGTAPDDISAESLGPWAETSFHLRGDIGIVSGGLAFGVAFRNGLGQPWAFGPRPATILYDNPALSGTVIWNGALVGVTPSGREVVGDTALSLDMDDFLGRIAFTGLRYGGGGTWGDGDLRYAVQADDLGNTFRRAESAFGRAGSAHAWNGRDLGTVTGAFFGSRHEGMGGTLERHDLSAAFGGKR